MIEWSEEKLIDVLDVIKDVYLPNVSESLPYIGLEHIEQGTLKLAGIGDSINVVSNKFRFCVNDILFGKLRPYFRKVVRPKFGGICSTDILVLRAKQGFDQEFMFYFVANWEFINLANSAESGTRMPRADWNYLKNTSWNIPPLQEQKAIAGVLSSLDDKIDLLHRQNKTLESLAETMFRQWFIEEAVEGPKFRVEIGDVLESISVTHELLGDDIIFLNTSDIYLGEVLKHTPESVVSLPGQAKKTIQKGDILFSEIRPANGRYAYIDFEAQNYVVSTKLMVLRSCSNIPTSFLYFFLTNKNTIEWLQMLAESRSGTFPQITFDNVAKLKLCLPEERIYNISVTVCDTLLKKIKTNHFQIRSLTKLRDTILPKLMSGEVRVSI